MAIDVRQDFLPSRMIGRAIGTDLDNSRHFVFQTLSKDFPESALVPGNCVIKPIHPDSRLEIEPVNGALARALGRDDSKDDTDARTAHG